MLSERTKNESFGQKSNIVKKNIFRFLAYVKAILTNYIYSDSAQ